MKTSRKTSETVKPLYSETEKVDFKLSKKAVGNDMSLMIKEVLCLSKITKTAPPQKTTGQLLSE